MERRLDLQRELCEVLGSNNVYFQPPPSITLKYPCIVYSLDRIQSTRANNSIYKADRKYSITVIDRNPDSEIPKRILASFRMCEFETAYTAENLNHFHFSIFY